MRTIMRLAVLLALTIILWNYVSIILAVWVFLIGAALVLINARYRRCPSCERVNPRNAAVCSHCHKQLLDGGAST